jgi:hypothetical protein
MVRRFLPSLSDWLFAALLGWLFAASGGFGALLADGDTGWHIRTGEYILSHGTVPRLDLYSFSRAGAPWCAWEWGADAILALAHRAAGLKGVVLLAGTVICAYLLVLFHHMLWRGANALVALVVCLVAAGASDIHFLARPHIFTLLFLAASLWLVDRDRERPGRAVWALIPLTAAWANLHAGFLGLIASLAAIAAGEAVSNLRAARRRLLLAAGCLAASVVNPYGIGLHRHALSYLRSSWIREAVDEFQSPKFRSEASLYFEVLLFAGLMAAAWLIARRRLAEPALMLLWAHAALGSVRHVPVFALAAAPAVAAVLTAIWEGWAASAASVSGTLRSAGRDLAAAFHRPPLWAPAILASLALAAPAVVWPGGFPEDKFPVALIERQRTRIAGARVFSSDQWGGYLLYRFPGQKVFIDGRSDFYGPGIGKLYLRVAYAHADWRKTLDGYGFACVLAPREWPLAAALGADPAWRAVDRDARAILFERAAPLKIPAYQPK